MCVGSETTVLDLFCGAGGFSLGFAEAGFTTIAGIDINEHALATYDVNHEAEALNLDIGEEEPDDILDELGVEPEDIDVVVGGPPCQGFSRAGDRDPDDDRNDLVDDYFTLLNHVRPEMFAMENVPSIRSHDGDALGRLERNIENIGYEYDYEVLDAADYGVPQNRRRLILIGSEYAPTGMPDAWETGTRPIADALDGDGHDDTGRPYLTTSPSGDGYQVRGRDDFRDTQEPSFCHTGRYVRLIPQEFEPHEDATPASVQHRRLTKQEMARIQSFPDDFEWKGNGRMRQQGNAVPPLMAEAIASRLTLQKYQNLRVRLREDASRVSWREEAGRVETTASNQESNLA